VLQRPVSQGQQPALFAFLAGEAAVFTVDVVFAVPPLNIENVMIFISHCF
jgi:hypothetical protein